MGDALGLQTGMSQNSPLGPLQNTSLTFWLIAAVIAVILMWGVWHFGRLSAHPARNNPGVFTISELIWNKA